MRKVQRGVKALRKRLSAAKLKRAVAQFDSAQRPFGDAGSQPVDEALNSELGVLEA